ncbi:Stp1/IreP family PP2C-type Ser/Thr phosphatase [Leucobacter allii]|uniref:Stp1/IreP family PP2C-type Ser/Thr phosphatase n=1 Tax=Leucobacter allii TaxID=2932247 RepID=A0ABY4FL90_9MICO|nr:Stp1/IreP family PP2C-type Ser/Thr phosphatase [Leucobacter allii]UOQ57035.1 Stp1/IreP family PP2C-type Ser/Thr phosphatase [Leucobacter allii]UOR01546.1 Stp1/IreP family PP2C-type Ser/Thr phosphatase [Leucobacter allii]
MGVAYTSAIGSHVGMVRSNNQDSGFAGGHLFLVADGMGGHAGGDVASAIAAKALSSLDVPPTGSAETATNALRTAILEANAKLRATVRERPELAGMGTTFTGFIPVGDRLALAHIGDSRLYLLRDGALQQITKDHTFVQRLVDSGKITEEEAKTHPRRSVLMRVLGDVDSSPQVDTRVLDTRPGDVWLLCSDGLCGYVEDDDIEKILRRRTSLQGAVDALIDKSLAHGAPDNVTVVLVETEAAPELDPDDTRELVEAERRFVGSAATAPEPRDGAVSTARTRILGRRRPVRRPPVVEESHFEPRVDEYLAELIAETRRRNRNRRVLWALGAVVVLLGIAGALGLGYQWTQSRYFVGTDGETVIIYRGVQQNLGSFSLHSVAEDTDIPLSELDGLEQRQVERTLGAGSLEEARDIVLRLGVHEDE